VNLFDLYAKIVFDDSEYKKGVDNTKKTNKELSGTFTSVSQNVQTLRNRIGILSSQYTEAQKRVEEIAKKFNESAQKTGLTSKETKELAEQLDEATGQMESSKSELQKYNVKLDDTAEKSENAESRLSKFASTLKNGFSAALNFTTGAIGVASTAITALGKIAFDYNTDLESYQTNFEVMLGDAEKAKAKVAELADMGAKTPFELSDLANATQTLLAFNVSADSSTDVLQKLGDISLGNVQKLESLTRAYGKMSSSQKVTLEDINMMIDAGYNPLLNIQDATGESMEQLYERISKGEVAFTEIEAAIEAATGAGGMYENGMQKASQTTQGLISTLKDNVQALVAKVFTPVTNGLTKQVLPAAIDAIQKLSDAYEQRGIEGMIDAAGEIVGTAVGELAKNAPKLITSGVQLIESLAKGIEDNEDAITEGAAQTFFAFANGVVRLIPTLLGVAVGLVTGFGRYIIENPDEVIHAAGELIANIAIGLAESIPELAVTALGVVTSLGSYLVENGGEILSDAAAVGARVLEGIWNGIVAGWSNLTSKVKAKLQVFLDGLMNISVGNTISVDNTLVGGGFAGNGGAHYVNGSHAGGLDYVPFDGYIAELHEGERVLTAEEARSAKSMSVQIIINGVEYDNMRDLAHAVAEELEFIAETEAASFA